MSKRYKIAILGSTGMLGHAVGQYFDNHPDYEAHLSYRDPKLAYGTYNFRLDAFEYISRERTGSMEPFEGFDYVINCIGGIKQHSFTDMELSKLNTMFPITLSARCALTGAKLIHVSTDCVFSGKKGTYTEDDTPDPEDVYGMTKLIGESPSCMVLRTSLIGEELHSNVSLLGWAKSQAGKEVNGFTNHRWNGVTTKEFARICDKIIQKELYITGRRHVFNPTPVSKAEMLEAFNSRFNLGLKINHVLADTVVDRSLATRYSLCNELNIPGFAEMIAAM